MSIMTYDKLLSIVKMDGDMVLAGDSFEIDGDCYIDEASSFNLDFLLMLSKLGVDITVEIRLDGIGDLKKLEALESKCWLLKRIRIVRNERMKDVQRIEKMIKKFQDDMGIPVDIYADGGLH